MFCTKDKGKAIQGQNSRFLNKKNCYKVRDYDDIGYELLTNGTEDNQEAGDLNDI